MWQHLKLWRYNIAMKWLLIMVLFPALVFASENCAVQFHGKCKDECAPGEVAAEGAFIDCADKEECCVEKESPKKEDRSGHKDSGAARDTGVQE
jgi:hypothetical protein